VSVSAPFLAPSVQVGAWQVPPVHTPFVQSVAWAHSLPSAHGAQAPPPQSTSLSLPSTLPSAQVSTRQDPELHAPLAQSAFTVQVAPVAHGEQSPPQSIDVSEPSFTPSEQVAGRAGFRPPSGVEGPCPVESESSPDVVHAASRSPTITATKQRNEDMVSD